MFPYDCHDDIFREFALVCQQERVTNVVVVPPPIVTSFHDKAFMKKPTSPCGKTDVHVVNMDTVSYIVHLIETGVNPDIICALNMGNPYIPGAGMVSRNFITQEEDILRRCDMVPHLPLSIYPLKPDQAVLSKSVAIKRDANYNYYSNEYTTSFLTACALIAPAVQTGRFVKERDRETTYNKMDLIFRTAHLYGYKVLVLAPFGLGAFMNPQQEIIDMFNGLLQKYDKCFDTITFAIVDNDTRGNLQLFKNGIKPTCNF